MIIHPLLIPVACFGRPCAGKCRLGLTLGRISAALIGQLPQGMDNGLEIMKAFYQVL